KSRRRQTPQVSGSEVSTNTARPRLQVADEIVELLPEFLKLINVVGLETFIGKLILNTLNIISIELINEVSEFLAPSQQRCKRFGWTVQLFLEALEPDPNIIMAGYPSSQLVAVRTYRVCNIDDCTFIVRGREPHKPCEEFTQALFLSCDKSTIPRPLSKPSN